MPVIVSEIRAALFIADKANQLAQAILAYGKIVLVSSSFICKYFKIWHRCLQIFFILDNRNYKNKTFITTQTI